MAPYSMDLRERVVRAWDASGDADEVAATFAVSRAWVHRLVQRRRETGSIAPRQQTKFRSRVLAGQETRVHGELQNSCAILGCCNLARIVPCAIWPSWFCISWRQLL